MNEKKNRLHITDRIEIKPIGELFTYINNPAKYSEDDVNRMASFIKHFGFVLPLVIDNDNEIVHDEKWYLAARKLKMDMVPCVNVNHLTEAEIRAFRIASKKIEEDREWDETILSAELEILKEEYNSLEKIAEMTAFSMEEIDKLVEFEIPNFNPVSEDEQPRLDELDPKKKIICPVCGHEFEV